VVVRVPNRARQLAAPPRGAARGFTLIELMVVVIIIGALAVLAIPTISGQMRSRRAQFVAKEVSNLYRNGRMRAMGRGSAVMIRYSRAVDTEGRLDVLEAVRTSPNPACDRLPMSSCTVTDWAAANQTQSIGGLMIKGRAELEGVRARARDPGNNDVATMDVCFTPMGRAFVRYAAIGPFTPLTAVPRLMVTRVDTGTNVPVGPSRWVLVLPNGSARLGTATTEASL
jgi:prepilin-type N-terminal cleavage/methylation domain-containing protein